MSQLKKPIKQNVCWGLTLQLGPGLILNCPAHCGNGNMLILILVVEISGNQRTLTGVHTHTAFAVGYTLNSLVAYFLRDWRWFYFVISLTPIPYFIIHFFVSFVLICLFIYFVCLSCELHALFARLSLDWAATRWRYCMLRWKFVLICEKSTCVMKGARAGVAICLPL